MEAIRRATSERPSPSAVAFKAVLLSRAATVGAEAADMSDVDDEFYERADAHIRLSNDQLSARAVIKETTGMNGPTATCDFQSVKLS